MKNRNAVLALVLALSLTGSALIAQTASAEVLSNARAHQFSERVTREIIAGNPHFTGFKVEPCERRDAHHVNCRSIVYGEDSTGLFHCTWINRLSLREGSRGIVWDPTEPRCFRGHGKVSGPQTQ